MSKIKLITTVSEDSIRKYSPEAVNTEPSLRSFVKGLRVNIFGIA